MTTVVHSNNIQFTLRMTDSSFEPEIYHKTLQHTFHNIYNINEQSKNYADIILEFIIGINHQQYNFVKEIQIESNNTYNKSSSMDIDQTVQRCIVLNLYKIIDDQVKKEEQTAQTNLHKLLQKRDVINVTLKLIPNDIIYKQKFIQIIKKEFNLFHKENITTLDFGKDCVYFVLKEPKSLPLVILTSTTYKPIITVSQYPALKDDAFGLFGMIITVYTKTYIYFIIYIHCR